VDEFDFRRAHLHMLAWLWCAGQPGGVTLRRFGDRWAWGRDISDLQRREQAASRRKLTRRRRTIASLLASEYDR
jgi:hypothetical protein